MKIYHVSCEFGPLIKVGGLGEVVYGLSKATKKLGHSVEVILPYVPQLFLQNIPLKSSYIKNKHFSLKAFKGHFQGILLTLLHSDEMKMLFNRPFLYGYNDDPYRFITFCKTVAQYLHQLPQLTSIIHLHDWHVAFLSAIIKSSNKLTSLSSILTIHSFAYQGFCSSSLLKNFSLNKKIFKNFLIEKNNLSLLKGGILLSDYVTTVSPSYAKEVLDKIPKTKIQNALSSVKNKKKFVGILNGIDTDFWNPETDPYLHKNYSILKEKNYKDLILAKEKNKISLRKKLKLAQGNYPLIIVVSRLVKEKGLKFILSSIMEILQQKAQLIILGSCFDSKTLQKFSLLQRALNTSKFIHIHLKFSETLAHQLYSAADISLVPSLIEPCGLTQLISMRYGTLPLVRNTGGLSDTVRDKKTGFVFYNNNIHSFLSKLKEAIDMCKKKPDIWWTMIRNAMNYNSDWNLPAHKYAKIYYKIKKKI